MDSIDSLCRIAPEKDVSISRTAGHHGIHTGGLGSDVQWGELLILDEIVDFETVGGATRRTRVDYARHGKSGLGRAKVSKLRILYMSRRWFNRSPGKLPMTQIDPAPSRNLK